MKRILHAAILARDLARISSQPVYWFDYYFRYFEFIFVFVIAFIVYFRKLNWDGYGK